MPAKPGRNLLLKLDDGTGTFVTLAGLRTKTLTFNARSVDVTTAESTDRWRELLAGAGARSVSLSGSGIFKDAASDALLRGTFFDGSIAAWQIAIPDFGTLEGPFQIVSLTYQGEHDGEVTFDIALESAGAPSFTAA